MDWFSFSLGAVAGALVGAWLLFLIATIAHGRAEHEQRQVEQLRIARRQLR